MFEQKNWAKGLWKFSDKISKEELGKLAEEWKSQDANYLELYLRKVSKDQMGIGFTYRLPENEDIQTGHANYFDRTSDSLKRKFGNDLVGWDIGTPVWIIKDAAAETI